MQHVQLPGGTLKTSFEAQEKCCCVNLQEISQKIQAVSKAARDLEDAETDGPQTVSRPASAAPVCPEASGLAAGLRHAGNAHLLAVPATPDSDAVGPATLNPHPSSEGTPHDCFPSVLTQNFVMLSVTIGLP